MEERKEKGEAVHLDINLKVKYNAVLFLKILKVYLYLFFSLFFFPARRELYRSKVHHFEKWSASNIFGLLVLKYM